jgi:hypothetical protein
MEALPREVEQLREDAGAVERMYQLLVEDKVCFIFVFSMSLFVCGAVPFLCSFGCGLPDADTVCAPVPHRHTRRRVARRAP